MDKKKQVGVRMHLYMQTMAEAANSAKGHAPKVLFARTRVRDLHFQNHNIRQAYRPPTSTRRHTRRIMESSSEPDSDDALPKHAYQELLEAFRLRHCISTQIDGTKLNNGFTELIGYAITQHYPTLEYLSKTGRTTFVEDMIRKYEHVIQRAIQGVETHDCWNIHCNNMLILDRERRKRRGKGQANAQVSLKLQREL